MCHSLRISPKVELQPAIACRQLDRVATSNCVALYLNILHDAIPSMTKTLTLVVMVTTRQQNVATTGSVAASSSDCYPRCNGSSLRSCHPLCRMHEFLAPLPESRDASILRLKRRFTMSVGVLVFGVWCCLVFCRGASVACWSLPSWGVGSWLMDRKGGDLSSVDSFSQTWFLPEPLYA